MSKPHPPNERLPEDPEVRPHIYDGIEEFDNKLPNWWLWTFYLAVIFTFLYWFLFYDSDVFSSDAEAVEAVMNEMDEVRLANMGDLSDQILWEMAQNPSFVEAGRELYFGDGTCVTCHGPNLEGGVGLSLVDHEWRWGNRPMSIYAIIADGSPDRASGMQAWMGRLGPQKISQLVAFVLSHHNPEGMASATTLNPPIEPDL